MFRLKVDDEIELGLLEGQHAQSILELTSANLDYISKWLPPIASMDTVEKTAQFIKGGLKRFAENNGFLAGIWYKGELVGGIVLRYCDWNIRTTEAGYWLGEAYTGKGIATRATRKVVDYAFNDLGLKRVEIRCSTENMPSRAIAERLGFPLEGILRQAYHLNDDLIDVALYSVLASEWKPDNEQP